MPLSVEGLIHTWGCQRRRCTHPRCTSCLGVLVRMEHHVSSESRACDAATCKICRLWALLSVRDAWQHSTAEPPSEEARFDRSEPHWRRKLHAERSYANARHVQLMRRWRGVVRCVAPLRVAMADAAARAYAPSGNGAALARDHFVAVSCAPAEKALALLDVDGANSDFLLRDSEGPESPERPPRDKRRAEAADESHAFKVSRVI
jgi:hypothetical protein